MRQLIKPVFSLMIFLFFFIISSTLFVSVGTDNNDNLSYDGVYFASYWCTDCQGLADDGVMDTLENEGYLILNYYLVIFLLIDQMYHY